MQDTRDLENARGDVQRYPEGLVRWSGDSDGGVRKPFKPDTGRPTGEQIATPLVKRLNKWAVDLIDGKKVPRVIFLVGGPGNGKTDAIEGCINTIDNELKADGELMLAFENKYDLGGAELPPRKVSVELTTLLSGIPKHLGTTISLVQDATEEDPSNNKSAEELLLDDLNEILRSDYSDIYLCCVNRGILASAAEISHQKDPDSEETTLLSTITQCVTSNAISSICWPLEKYTEIAIWPMDVESLVDRNLSEDGKSVAHKIFASALDANKWREPCELKTRCPFCQNRKLLTQGNALDSLIEILHYYELESGKKWTFRDLFSLVPYLLVGDPSELEVNGKRLSPCEWSAKQLQFQTEGVEGSTERDWAPYLLMSRLYHHRLFPRWPSFDKGDIRNAKRDLLEKSSSDNGLKAAKALFRYTARSKRMISRVKGDVPVRVRDSLAIALDPALLSGEEHIANYNGVGITIDDLEERFSLSVGDGLDLISNKLETLERDVLEKLRLADESLIEDEVPKNRTKQARLLQSVIRQFSSRIAKRNLGTKNGLCRNIEEFKVYVEATQQNTKVLADVRKGLKNLLNSSDGKFKAGLATTFGQPIAHRSRDVSLVLQSSIAVKIISRDIDYRIPNDSLPYLSVEEHTVALTFDLFKALTEINNGLNSGSLQSEIYSLLDRVRSLVSGRVVRDPDVLADDPVITLGSSNDKIELINGKFIYTKGAD